MEKEIINREAISSTDVRINADSIGTVEKRLVWRRHDFHLRLVALGCGESPSINTNIRGFKSAKVSSTPLLRSMNYVEQF